MKTVIKNGVVIAWVDGQHQALANADVVFEGNEIIFVGNDYQSSENGGPIDEVIDATGRLVIPGLVNTHLHVTDTLYTKGYLEDVRKPVLEAPSGAVASPNSTNLYTILPAIRNATSPDAQVAAAQCAFSELALSGSTTVVELAYDFEIGEGGNIELSERVADVAGISGLRCYSGPRY
jgi:cytosine/adenosine deaminase-related metal-dependent hydrolase